MPYFAKINIMILNRYKWTESWLKHQYVHEINGIIKPQYDHSINALSDWSRSHVTGQTKHPVSQGMNIIFHLLEISSFSFQRYETTNMSIQCRHL